jgi:hypothetical protein
MQVRSGELASQVPILFLVKLSTLKSLATVAGGVAKYIRYKMGFRDGI